MHAIAPGRRLLPQAGQALGEPPAALAAASAVETDGRVMDGAEDTDCEVEAAVAPTVCRAGAGGGPPAVNGFLQWTQRNCFPSEPSARDMGVLQCGHFITYGMVVDRSVWPLAA
jgi:hypothetical protein